MIGRRILFASWIFGAGYLVDCVPAWGQTVERDTTITGPRGRSIERKVEVQRTPGGIDRSVQITRPGGTFDRQVQIQRSPAGGPWRGGGFVPGPRPWGFIPRPVFIQPAPAFGFGLMAAPMMNFSFGGGGGGIGGGFGGGMGAGGGPGPGMMGPGGPPPGAPPDHVALESQRLQSFFSNTRKDAAYHLGQLGDPRAVPSLVHVLKYDTSKDVRVAAAIALGEIGGSEAAVALERDAIYDHREEVRKASSIALERLNAKAKAAPPAVMAPPAGMPPRPPVTSAPSPFRESPGSSSVVDQPSLTSPDAEAPPKELIPPPPPTPVTSGPGGPVEN